MSAPTKAPAPHERSAPRSTPARALHFLAFVAALGAMVPAMGACSPNQPRDVVSDARDVRVTDAGAAPRANDGYVYVARRAHGAIGLVGTKHLAVAEAEKVVERLADALDACATRQQAQGTLATGAATLVVVANTRGNADVSDMQLSPGGPVAANALECLVGPARAITLPPSTETAFTALAIEATWNPAGGPAATDAGVGSEDLSAQPH